MGRKRKYETYIQPYLKDITEWLGTMTEREIAHKLGVAVSTWENYKNEHPELVEALKQGRRTLADELKETLRMKAKGFHYTEKKKVIKGQGADRITTYEEYERYSIPDTAAIHLLLKNLDDNWRNDDAATMEIKKQKMEIEKEKAEAENW